MKYIAVLAVALLSVVGANAQIIRALKTDLGWTGGAVGPMIPDLPSPVFQTFEGWSVRTGTLFEGQTTQNLGEITSLTFAPPRFLPGGPLVRAEIVSFDPFRRGPLLLSFGDPISMIFDKAVDAVGITLSHDFTANLETFAAGEAQVFAFDEAGRLLGAVSSTATSGLYTDPTTWEFIGLRTADNSASIKGISVYNANRMVGIDLHLLLGQSADVSIPPVPEPSTFGLIGAALLGGLIIKRRQTQRTGVKSAEAKGVKPEWH